MEHNGIKTSAKVGHGDILSLQANKQRSIGRPNEACPHTSGTPAHLCLYIQVMHLNTTSWHSGVVSRTSSKRYLFTVPTHARLLADRFVSPCARDSLISRHGFCKHAVGLNTALSRMAGFFWSNSYMFLKCFLPSYMNHMFQDHKMN